MPGRRRTASQALRATSTAIALLGAIGCGAGSQAAGDAGPDPGKTFEPPPCELTFGRSYIIWDMALLDEGQGLDLNGDGIADNQLGFIAPVANQALQDGIDLGTQLHLLDIFDWEHAPTANDPDVTMVFYAGADADDPPDVSNNYGGAGEFYVFDRQLDVNCQPLSLARHSTITDRKFVAELTNWPLLVAQIGTITYQDPRLEAMFDDDFETLTGVVGMAWPICSLHRISGPLFGGRSLLDFMVAVFGRPNPDVDLDGDGPESLAHNGETVTQCFDGDGSEVLGPDCPCDARMADGFSAAVRFGAVRATLLGVVESK
jgi:hypothetical protein